jgi:hypothetical protein
MIGKSQKYIGNNKFTKMAVPTGVQLNFGRVKGICLDVYSAHRNSGKILLL